MSTSGIFGLVAVVGIATVGFAYLVTRAGLGGGLKNKFKAKPLLTANELEFMGRLESAVPELRFHAQVSMGALLDPAVSRQDGKEFFRLRGMFSQKIVDFVAQDRDSGAVVAIVELDDRTHNFEKDAKRDLMLSGAGYRIVRWQSRNKPDSSAIRAVLLTGRGVGMAG